MGRVHETVPRIFTDYLIGEAVRNSTAISTG
jgi:hypothetical protein